MKFREVKKIPGREITKPTKKKAYKNEKRLLAFYNKHIAIAEVIDWEKDYANIKVLYESLHHAVRRYNHLPIDVCKRNDAVYLIRTDMV